MQFGFRLENQASLIIERQVHKFKGVWECLNNVKHCEIDDFIFLKKRLVPVNLFVFAWATYFY